MKKTTTSLRVRLIEASIMLLIVLVTLGLAISSWGWFGKNRAVAAKKMSIHMSSSSGISAEVVRMWRRDGLIGAREITGEENIVMSEYDTVFPDRNVNTPIIIRSELSILPQIDETGTVVAYLPFEMQVDCAALDGWLDENGENPAVTHLFSNICEIRFACVDEAVMFEGETVDEDGNYSDDVIYETAKKYLEENTAALCFVEEIDAGQYASTPKALKSTFHIEEEAIDKYYKKSEQIKVTIPTDVYLPLLEASAYSHVVVYIELDYNDELVNLYTNQNGIEIGIPSDDDPSSSDTLYGAVNFDYDLGIFYFEYAEEEED